jgi:hypothetical protein
MNRFIKVSAQNTLVCPFRPGFDAITVDIYLYFNLPLHSSRFPQQLPGPSQPVCVGEEPQQAVSPGPGNLEAAPGTGA